MPTKTTKKEIHWRCKKCGDEIYWNTHKKMVMCKCKALGVDEATPGEIAEKANVARPTVNQVLDKLLRLKKVERVGLGRSTRYRKL